MEESESKSVTGKRAGKRALVITGMKEAGVLLGHGVWAFAITVTTLAVAGVVVGVVCALIIPEGFWWRALAATLVLAIFVVEGWLLGVKRAFATMTVVAVRRFRVASRVLGLLFDGMERLLGEAAMRKTERLPLRRAEEVLRRAIAPLSGEFEAAGWFRRWVLGWMHRRLVKLVVLITLAEFRRAEAEQGGIELEVARERLAGKIDRLVERRVLGSARKVIWLIMGVSVVVVMGAAVAVRAWRLHAAAAVPSSLPAETQVETR